MIHSKSWGKTRHRPQAAGRLPKIVTKGNARETRPDEDEGLGDRRGGGREHEAVRRSWPRKLGLRGGRADPHGPAAWARSTSCGPWSACEDTAAGQVHRRDRHHAHAAGRGQDHHRRWAWSQGLGKIGKRVVGAIRQPSGGPTFNIKGSAAGGGLAQCIPLTAVLASA